MRTGYRHGPWNSLPLYLGDTIGVSASLDSAIGTRFYKLLSVFAILYTLRMSKFHMPTFINHRNNSKTAPINLYFVQVSTWGSLPQQLSATCVSANFSLVNMYAIQDTRLFHILTSFVHVGPLEKCSTLVPCHWPWTVNASRRCRSVSSPNVVYVISGRKYSSKRQSGFVLHKRKHILCQNNL